MLVTNKSFESITLRNLASNSNLFFSFIIIYRRSYLTGALQSSSQDTTKAFNARTTNTSHSGHGQQTWLADAVEN
jgi:hypothetical protein